MTGKDVPFSQATDGDRALFFFGSRGFSAAAHDLGNDDDDGDGLVVSQPPLVSLVARTTNSHYELLHTASIVVMLRLAERIAGASVWRNLGCSSHRLRHTRPAPIDRPQVMTRFDGDSCCERWGVLLIHCVIYQGKSCCVAYP